MVNLARYLKWGVVGSILILSQAARADWLSGSTDGNFKAHCPYAGEFTIAVIQPVAHDQFMLQCMNNTGSSYHTETGAISVDPTDKAWITQSYPPMWICAGNLVEDCGFFNGTS